MKVDIPSLGILSIDFQYVKIPRRLLTQFQVGDGAVSPAAVKTTWKLKTICLLSLGEVKYQTHVWSSAQHEQGFNKKEERKRALAEGLGAMFPKESGRGTRRLIWSALHDRGFHPFPVSRVDRLTKLLETAKKRAARRIEKSC